MRKVLVISWLAILLCAVCFIFWRQEWRYSLPTPVPTGYKTVKVGDRINLTDDLPVAGGKPLFIHFFNPECPCSRFNIPHFNSLVKKYGSQMTFAVVVTNPAKIYTAKYIQDKYDISVPVISDTTLAAKCGVYSTPQAVLIDTSGALYYRGNYNRSRYCTDMKSNFAQQAIDSLLHQISNPSFSQYAIKAYGCQATYCNR